MEASTNTSTVVIHCTPSHLSRARTYLEEAYNCSVLKQTDDLLFIRSSTHSTEELVLKFLNHPFLLRSIHTFLLVDDVSGNHEEIIAKTLKSLSGEEILRVKTLPMKIC